MDPIARVQSLGAGLSGLPHSPEDLQPAVAGTTDGTGVALALILFLPVVGLDPGTLLAAAISALMLSRPQVHRDGTV